MNFLTLEHTDISTIAAAFNLAFSDYLVPVKHSIASLQNNFRGQNVQMHLSAGAFHNDRLVGFLLTGTDDTGPEKRSYNAGTGVIPEMRGQHLTTRLYDFLLPILRAAGYRNNTLEVITQNAKAQKVYMAQGYRTTRELYCFKGTLTLKDKATSFAIRPLPDYPRETMMQFRDWAPSWQNSLMAIELLAATNVSLGLYDGDTLIGYLIFNPLSERVHQFAVHPTYRRRGAATQLFAHIAQHYTKDIAVINTDAGDAPTTAFLQNAGLENFVQQYEMELRF